MNRQDVIITVKDNFIYKIRRFMQSCAYVVFGAENMAKIYYRIVMKKRLNLKNPVSFTEKINWYKLYYCPENQLIIQCSDKYNVRDFLDSLGLEKYKAEIINSWKNPDEIVWEDLPDKFVLKNTNGCGYNIICRNKSSLNEKETKKLLKKWLSEHFGYYNAEPHYEKGEKQIICEKYIKSEDILPLDYKMHCMNGMPKVLQVCEERDRKETKYIFYDTKGIPFSFGKYPRKNRLDISEELLAEMVSVREKVAKYFPYVRVDFFINKGGLQISELTFSPSAGLKPDLLYRNADNIMGEMWDSEGLMA